MDCEIIGTGSSGNAVVINGNILIDCGLPFAKIRPYYKSLKLVLLTHAHSDHFNKSVLGRLAYTRPTLRFATPPYLIPKIIEAGVKSPQIDVMMYGTTYQYKGFDLEPFKLTHNVPNTGYKILFENGEKVIYATDTNNLDNVDAKDFDLYLIEANHTEEDIRRRIKAKEKNGEFAYEKMAEINHLSKEKADDFIYKNIGAKGRYIYLHGHIDKNGKEEENGDDQRKMG